VARLHQWLQNGSVDKIMKCNHLNIVGESYGAHLFFTVQVSLILLFLSIVSIIHGLCPWILTGTVSDKIKHLNKRLSTR
jgi:hypothetical protein